MQADLIYPTFSYLERDGLIFLRNTDYKLKYTRNTIGAPVAARDIRNIFINLNEFIFYYEHYKAISATRYAYDPLFKHASFLSDRIKGKSRTPLFQSSRLPINEIEQKYSLVDKLSFSPDRIFKSKIYNICINNYITNYFQTDLLSENSKTLAVTAAKMKTVNTNFPK